ncbi:MAG: DUF4153 domain-containing protein [Bacteroides sp.]|nr:DUF4153 domain-containing protein [Bacteroides sp.]
MARSNFIQRSLHTATEAFRQCLKRFPITVGFIFALTVFLLRMTAQGWKGDERLMWTISYYLSVGTLLSLTLHLWCEEVKRQAWKVGIHLLIHALFVVDALYLYNNITPESSFTEIGIAHAAGILAVGLSVFFLSFQHEKNDIPSWNFAAQTLSAYAVAAVVGYIMAGGISLLIFSLEKLFDADISMKCYGYVLILCCVPLALLLFLGLIPQGDEKHNPQPQASSFLTGILHYLFLPLTAGYLLVLYIYAARILSAWELPIGWVSWLVVALMTVCILLEFGLYPARFKQEGNRFDQWIARWLPVLVLPLLLLMTAGIVRRISDYGITINRLYLATLNAWFYLVCIGLFITKARRINWIPISFALIFLLTSILPVNYASITRKTLYNGIAEAMQQGCETEPPLSFEEYENWLSTLPAEESDQLNDHLLYMQNWFGAKSISGLLKDDAISHLYSHKYAADTLTEESTKIDYIQYSATIEANSPILIPDGYTHAYCIPPTKEITTAIFTLPRQQLEEGMLTVDFEQECGVKAIANISVSTLEELSKNKNGIMPSTSFDCTSDKYTFVMTYFWLAETEKDDEIMLSIRGYLFVK